MHKIISLFRLKWNKIWSDKFVEIKKKKHKEDHIINYYTIFFIRVPWGVREAWHIMTTCGFWHKKKYFDTINI